MSALVTRLPDFGLRENGCNPSPFQGRIRPIRLQHRRRFWRRGTRPGHLRPAPGQRRPLEQKPFAIGVRIEHHQEAISRSQYGPAWDQLPPSDYRLSCHLPTGRSAFSFCVCPGGTVVASASSPGHLVTNGMSYRARDRKNINGGLLVGVTPEDFPGLDVLAGVRFQEHWERLAYEAGGGGFRAQLSWQAIFWRGGLLSRAVL